MTVQILGKMTAHPGRGADLQKVLGESVIPAVALESGCVSYSVFRDIGEPDICWLWEVFADEAAFEAHRSSTAMASAGGLVAPLVIDVETIRLEPVGVHNVPASWRQT